MRADPERTTTPYGTAAVWIWAKKGTAHALLTGEGWCTGLGECKLAPAAINRTSWCAGRYELSAVVIQAGHVPVLGTGIGSSIYFQTH